MKLSNDLQRKLKKQYDSNSFIESKFKGLDIAFKTDHDGNPIVLFVGKKISDGKIKGERFVRTLQKDLHGAIVKDHWDLKGPVS
jgi:hypothetical protein